MKWTELTISTTDFGLEPVIAALLSVGIDQVSIGESADQIELQLREMAPYWDYADAAALAPANGPCIKAYLPESPKQLAQLQAAKEAVLALPTHFPGEDLGSLFITETPVDDEDWANSWKQYYKPLPIGERLLICPLWEEATLTEAQRAGRLLIRMDPGMAFGTGAHHTTRLCLEMLQQIVQPNDRVLDIGCGSGILSIAALQLGAAHADCVDVDPVTEGAVRDNMAHNEVGQQRYTYYTGNILTPDGPGAALKSGYDIVIANIVADVIIALSPQAYALLRPGGIFLCSGIIEPREEDVLAALYAAGFSILERRNSKLPTDGDPLETGWLALTAGRKG